MCGIAGLLNKNRALIERDMVQAMTRLLHHRGPDEEGFYFDDFLGFGIQRLKIIDLESGSQPIHNEDQTIWVVLNGEIYNYRELRSQLESKDHRFYTNSDTETLVHAYEEWGDNFVEHLNGIYGLALWDKCKQRFILARDRLGVKPLYYYDSPNILLFASEIKALLLHHEVKREIDFNAFNNYFTFAYIPAPLTMFKNIKKLLPGHMLIWETNRTTVKQYWDVSYKINNDISEHDALEQLDSVLKKAVKRQLVSDVPLGLFLSGGIDSSILAALMSELMDRPVTTFSIAYDEKHYDESKYARLVADHFGTDHHEFVVRPDIMAELPKIIEHLDEPLANETALPLILLSKLAKKWVTVALNGAGGDEIFGGYDRYRRQKFLDWYAKVPKGLRTVVLKAIEKLVPGKAFNLESFKNKVRMVAAAQEKSLAECYMSWTSVISDECRAMIFSDQAKVAGDLPEIKSYFKDLDLDNVDKLMYVDTKTFLVDYILTMTDKMSMAHALEIRVPFLDHEVVEFAATIPAKYKVKNGKSKHLLRKYLGQVLPKHIWNRPKQGFTVPISTWFKQDKYYRFALDILLDNKARNRQLFNSDGIEQMLTMHKNGTRDYGGTIWALLNFELWNQKFLDN